MVAVFTMLAMNQHCPSVSRSTSQCGFTLLELMVVLAIAAILAALALPSFDSMVKRWRTKTAAENLVSGIYLARSEAARFGGVQMARIDGPECQTAGLWQCGWRVQTLGQDGVTLQTVEAIKSMVIMRRPETNTTSFNQFGQVNGLGAYSFVVVHQANQGDSSKAITVCVSSAGRVRTVRGTTQCT
ncbi:prepilin-type N-terminal cleavage/methylation domain-containing protein [Lampropedia aestuarii]|uniref:Type II secretion system protein H n=2 Tax=Lampropedia aestuarii TaxID=2562762 RepID=A0A4S5BSE0_9BURK|nr:prepilin-type N-terminal cleavage/methylation domain-containing protein [Lampropedia aestuarii]